MFGKKKQEETEFVWRDFREKTYEELEREVDNAYNEEIRKRNKKIAILLVVLAFVFHDVLFFWVKFGIPHFSKEKAPQVVDVTGEPVMNNLESVTILPYETLEDKENVDLQKLADYSISGKIVAKNYLFWGNYLPKGKRVFQSTALIDVGLVWGDLAENKNLDKYTFYSVKDVKHRGMKTTTKMTVAHPPLKWPYVRNHALTLHVVPANSTIMSALIYARKNQPVKLDGYLINIPVEDGKLMTSSMGRKFFLPNSHDGSSEIMYVDKIQIGKNIYR